jgi:bifunctional NMN adenylyltransferase/nudix hydrolase
MDSKKYKDLTILIGRFSPFHNGHAEVLKRAKQTSKAVLVLVGSSGQARTTKNPFTFEERKAMIENYAWAGHNDGIVRVLPLYDHPYNDSAWIRGVQEAVDQTKNELVDIIGLNPTVYLTGSDRDKSTWYLKTFGDLFIPDFVDSHPVGFELSATKVREWVFNQSCDHITIRANFDNIIDSVPSTTVELLEGFKLTREFEQLVKEYEFIQKYKRAWKAAPYAPIFSTVDNVVIQSGHVLVNVRDDYPGVGLWALPGGFLEQDETLLQGAIRELIEETSISLSKAQLLGSVRSKEIFDHPDRSLRGRTITTAFLLKLDDSKPLPKVKPQKGEVQKVMWLKINEALKHPENWFEDHYHILQTMYNRITQS